MGNSVLSFYSWLPTFILTSTVWLLALSKKQFIGHYTALHKELYKCIHLGMNVFFCREIFQVAKVKETNQVCDKSFECIEMLCLIQCLKDGISIHLNDLSLTWLASSSWQLRIFLYKKTFMPACNNNSFIYPLFELD